MFCVHPGVSIFYIHECMRNKTLYLLGDSTMRQWYSELKISTIANNFQRNGQQENGNIGIH